MDAHGLRAVDDTVHTLRGLLSAEDVASVKAAAAQVEATQEPLSYDNDLISADEMPFGLRAPHQSVFLHADHLFENELPRIFQRIVDAIRRLDAERQGRVRMLGVRTIEYHRYLLGGGLLDPDHCDMGSVLTLSCLLSEPSDVDGGVFVTFDGQRKARHHGDLRCGDAICFDSELRHNVSAVLRGVRQSLVVELWEQSDNTHDRHS